MPPEASSSVPSDIDAAGFTKVARGSNHGPTMFHNALHSLIRDRLPQEVRGGSRSRKEGRAVKTGRTYEDAGMSEYFTDRS